MRLSTIEILRPAKAPEAARYFCGVCGAHYRSPAAAALHASSTGHDFTPAQPKEGDRRTVRRFAWLPVRLSTGRRCWLAEYRAVEVWTDDCGLTTGLWVESEAHPLTLP